MKKRLLSVLMAAVMTAALLAGCGSKEEQQPAETEAPAEAGEAEAEAPTIMMVRWHSFRQTCPQPLHHGWQKS